MHATRPRAATADGLLAGVLAGAGPGGRRILWWFSSSASVARHGTSERAPVHGACRTDSRVHRPWNAEFPRGSSPCRVPATAIGRRRRTGRDQLGELARGSRRARSASTTRAPRRSRRPRAGPRRPDSRASRRSRERWGRALPGPQERLTAVRGSDGEQIERADEPHFSGRGPGEQRRGIAVRPRGQLAGPADRGRREAVVPGHPSRSRPISASIRRLGRGARTASIEQRPVSGRGDGRRGSETTPSTNGPHLVRNRSACRRGLGPRTREEKRTWSGRASARPRISATIRGPGLDPVLVEVVDPGPPRRPRSEGREERGPRTLLARSVDQESRAADLEAGHVLRCTADAARIPGSDWRSRRTSPPLAAALARLGAGARRPAARGSARPPGLRPRPAAPGSGRRVPTPRAAGGITSNGSGRRAGSSGPPPEAVDHPGSPLVVEASDRLERGLGVLARSGPG